mmetsp:Transcript_19305/g.74133  ORF Transcript_19305/g.74133 Transcript_19305/m.74133 type:complete len:605 (-) Transcript_19305:15-1829(-)
MCGICLVVAEGGRLGAASLSASEPVQEAAALLRLRGPDHIATEAFWGEGMGDDICSAADAQVGVCMAAVLHMRGQQVQAQPIRAAEEHSFLCWNGEVFAGEVEVSSMENDGWKLYERIRALEASAAEFDISAVLSAVEGPFAFCYWQAARSRLWFGRDPLGRRSLLIRGPLEVESGARQLLALSSVAFGVDRSVRQWVEVPPRRLYYVDFPLSAGAPMVLDDAAAEEECFVSISSSLAIGSVPWDLPSAVQTEPWEVDVPRGKGKMGTFRIQVPAMSLPMGSRQRQITDATVTFEEAVSGLEQRLREAVRRRVRELPAVGEGRAKVAVLFSGGLDSLVLAALVDEIVPLDEPVDLLNVAFGGWPYDVPDRATGRASARLLLRRTPNRRWRFVEVNVTRQELEDQQEALLQSVWPRATVMDMTIGPALWFAARGCGHVQTRGLDDEDGHLLKENYERHESKAKVLLLGHGADEQLAGYVRHRAAWRKRGKEGLDLELDKDVARIWLRNMGRDDRVISSLAKESRLPFLDRDVMLYVAQLDADVICDLKLPEGEGDKRILREVARHLRLLDASGLPKRALQFGSRISHLTRRKEGGHVRFSGYAHP